ncbi:hypothetical protein DL96DRAFT_1629760 [Flagelloscypha sp. PMI_526]|nr:hypothetical protein DL96DRAFT_1629760 [Flagelloscypha sp. PMI_526]
MATFSISPIFLPASPYNSPCFAAEICVQFTQWCSPATLLNLQKTSRYFYYLLTIGPAQDSWKQARRRFKLPDIPTNLHGWANMTEPALAQMVWGGGSCLNCGKTTFAFPTDYLLQVRLCSRGCRRHYLRHGSSFVTFLSWSYLDLIAKTSDLHQMGLYEAIPKREITKDDSYATNVTHIFKAAILRKGVEQYRRATAASQGDVVHPSDSQNMDLSQLTLLWTRRERAMPSLEKFCYALAKWTQQRDEDSQKFKNVHRTNTRVIYKLSEDHRIPLYVVQTHPIVLRACGQSQQELISFDNWDSGWWYTAAAFLRTQYKCSQCPKRFNNEITLEKHLRHKHPHASTGSIVFHGGTRCPYCVGKMRTFNVYGLQAHINKVHPRSTQIKQV